MIELEILKSSEKNQIGNYAFNKNRLVISTSLGEDLYIPFHKTLYKFSIEIIENKLYLINPQINEDLLVNNKYISEVKVLNNNDLIQFRDYQLLVKSFKHSIKKNLKDTINKNTDIIIEKHPEIFKLIKEIREQ